MYVVSCRRGFDSNPLIGKENLYRNYTNPADAKAFQDLTQDQILEQCKNKHVGILVHGYNNDVPEVMASYWKLVTQMKDSGVTGPKGYGIVLGFTWPGLRVTPGYFVALPNANKAGTFLADLVNTIRPVAHTVDVQTHSLGARVALSALKNPKKIFIDNLLLSAPAVDNHVLEPGEAFHASLDGCNRCLVYHSKNDPVLKLGYKIGDITDGIHPAIGLGGPRNKTITMSKCPNVYVVDSSARVKTHSGYRDSKHYFQHWGQVLSGGALSRYDELS